MAAMSAFLAIARRSTALALCSVLAAVLVSGCGSLGPSDEDLPNRDARLLLDAPPSGVHAGILLAASRGYDQGEGVRLRLRAARPADTAVRLLRSERVEAAVMDIHALARARERGNDLIGVMAFVQEPLTAVMAGPEIRAPADLEGRRVAVSDTPGERAALRALVSGDGGDVSRVRTVSTPSGAEALLGGRVDATAGRWDVEGVAIAAEAPGVRELRVGEFGAPDFPQLVLVVTRYTLDERSGTVRALIRTLQRGYREARVDPESAVAAIRESEPRADRELLLAQVAAVSPAWAAGADAYGELDATELQEWSDWAQENGALRRPFDVARAFDTSLVTRPQGS